MTNIITTKRELAAYLREHDPEMLEFFITAAKEFGPAETVAYITSAANPLNGEVAPDEPNGRRK